MKHYFIVEFCILTSRISDYPMISQGKTRIPGVNDGEDFELTDVSVLKSAILRTPVYIWSQINIENGFLNARIVCKFQSKIS